MKRDDRNLSVGERIKYALLAALLGIAAFLATACAGTGAQPATAGADPTATADPTAGADRATGAAVPDHLPADADFVRDMIVHHQQALDMTALAPDRTDSDDMRLLAERIQQTQEYEIDLMRRWLEERGEPLPGRHPGHEAHADHTGMAGMASPEQMAALAESEGAAFDRMFLELMIRHHEGALIMVDGLLETDGGGKEPNLYLMLSHIDADQRAEIARMRDLLDQMDETGENG